MDARQLVRVVAVVVAAALLGVLAWRMAGERAEVEPRALPGGLAESEYADLVIDLQSVLTAYAPLQGVTQHSEVHVVKQQLAGLEIALRDIEDQAGEAGADDVVTLSQTVRGRAVQVLAAAAADHTQLGGVALVQAFGREVALRAVRIGQAVEQALAQADDDGWGSVADAVAAPWPPPEDEGRGEAPTR